MARGVICSFALTASAIVAFPVLGAGISLAKALPNTPRIRIPHPAVAPSIHPAPGECAALIQFDAIAATVTINFYDRTFRGLPWLQRVKQFRRKVSCTDGPDRIAALANALFAELKASHTGVYTPDDLNYWALESFFSPSIDDYPVAFSGILPMRRGDKWFARYILQGSPAEQAGVLPGDELISINGKPYRPLGFRAAGATAALILSEDGKTRRTLEVKSEIRGMQEFFLVATRDSARIEQLQGHSVGYFHLWSGAGPLFLAALNGALANFERHHVSALILDLRGGYGGAGPPYLKKLQQDPYFRNVYKVALIDHDTRSGKELVAAIIKHDHLATLVGSRTAGAFLGASPVRLFNNSYLVEVAIGHYVPPGIGDIEGVGVEPDIAVSPCIRFCRGRDPQLAAALRLIERHLADK
jgi:carboxyl-terminal processing protease